MTLRSRFADLSALQFGRHNGPRPVSRASKTSTDSEGQCAYGSERAANPCSVPSLGVVLAPKNQARTLSTKRPLFPSSPYRLSLLPSVGTRSLIRSRTLPSGFQQLL